MTTQTERRQVSTLTASWHPEHHGEKPEAFTRWLLHYKNQPIDVAQRATAALMPHVKAMTWRNPLRNVPEFLPLDLPEADCQYLAAYERIRQYHETADLA